MIPAAFPPSDLLRRQPSDSLFGGFLFLRRLLAKLLGGLFLLSVLGQYEATETKTDGIGATRGENKGSHAARESGHVGPPNFHLVGLLVFILIPLRSPRKF